MTPAMRASRVLGWVSLAVGAAELLAPRRVAEATGLQGKETLLRDYGARELLAGVGAHSVYPVPALWSRVAGDLLDLGTLAYGGRGEDGRIGRNTWIAIAAVAGITALDAYVASRMAAETKEGMGEPKDYRARSGFPGGVEGARGAGVVGDAMAGKAGGGAAGDSSPAGKAATGRSSTDLNGAPERSQGQAGPAAEGSSSAAAAGGSLQSEILGGSGGARTMPQESQDVIPEPPAYTPA